MDVRELRSFSVAARLRSISRAAESLDIGQPTVSTHIKKLELELGTPLFDRIRRPIRLTLAGEKLLELAGPLVEGIEGLAASTQQAQAEGPVTVATTTNLTQFLLRAVEAFRDENPRVHLRLRSRLRSEVIEMVSQGEVDFGIVPGADPDAALEFEGLFPYERLLITPLNHPLLDDLPLTSFDLIAAYPLIMMGPGTYTRSAVEAEFRRKGLDFDIMMEADSLDLIKRYVGHGYGVAVIPRVVAEAGDEETLGIVPLGHILPVDRTGLITLRGRALSVPAAALIEEVKTAAEEM